MRSLRCEASQPETERTDPRRDDDPELPAHAGRVRLGRGHLKQVNAHLARKGLLLKRGSIVDATIIAAPSSTKNKEGERDPEMHQTKKGNQWHFGMKAHIGVDADSGLVHTVTTTPANGRRRRAKRSRHRAPIRPHDERWRALSEAIEGRLPPCARSASMLLGTLRVDRAGALLDDHSGGELWNAPGGGDEFALWVGN